MKKLHFLSFSLWCIQFAATPVKYTFHNSQVGAKIKPVVWTICCHISRNMWVQKLQFPQSAFSLYHLLPQFTSGCRNCTFLNSSSIVDHLLPQFTIGCRNCTFLNSRSIVDHLLPYFSSGCRNCTFLNSSSIVDHLLPQFTIGCRNCTFLK